MQNLLDFKPTMVSAYKMVVNYTGVPNEAGFLLNVLKTLFRAIRGTFRCLKMHSKRRYKICICSVILGELDSFRNF